MKLFQKLTLIFTKNFYKKQIKEYFCVLDVRDYPRADWTGLRIKIKLVRETTRFGLTDIESEIVNYDNVHRRKSENRFFTYCPYTDDRTYMSKLEFNHEGWGYLYNNDSTEHSFMKLSKKDIEKAVDEYWERNGITVAGNWN